MNNAIQSAKTEQITKRSQPWTIFWFIQGYKKEHLSRVLEIPFREPSTDTERILSWHFANRILTESKPEVQKTLICSGSREDTAESSGATRFSETLLTFIKSLSQMVNDCKYIWETRLGKKMLYSLVVCSKL